MPENPASSDCLAPRRTTGRLATDLARLDRPALVIWGARNRFVPVAQAQRQRESFPSAEVVVLGAGGYITKPRGEIHTMWNAGKTPARMIEVISPAGFEHFFRELAEIVAAGPPPAPDTVPNLAARYGLQLGRPACPRGDRLGRRSVSRHRGTRIGAETLSAGPADTVLRT